MTLAPFSSRAGILAAFLLVPAGTLGADALLVPEQYATIGEAVDAAKNGDVIQVAAGVYAENVQIYYKRIAIRGEKKNGVTIIDGSSPSNDCESCIFVASSDRLLGTATLTLDSLVLRNGRGCPVFGIRRGGGIYSEFASIELVDVVIEDCSLELDPFGQDTWGGAICSYFGSVFLERCTLRNNSSEGSGGAIWTTVGQTTVANSVISGNHAAKGGGIFCDTGTAFIADSIIGGNTATLEGGGVHMQGDLSYEVTGTTFDSNVADSGAGLYTNAVSGIVVDTRFQRGTAAEGGGIRNEQPDQESLSIGSSLFCGSIGGDVVGSWEDLDDANHFLEECSPLGDLDGDGIVNGADLSLLLGMWSTNGFPYGADLNFDGFVDGADLTIQLGNWTG